MNRVFETSTRRCKAMFRKKNDGFYESYQIMAKIVRDHGEKYLPLFKMLHDEHLARNARADLMEIAIQSVKKIDVFS